MRPVAAAFAILALSLAPQAGFAQEGCSQSKFSCSQMNVNCEKQCRQARNAAACVANYCSTSLSTCQATGIWKSVQNKAACWKASSRS